MTVFLLIAAAYLMYDGVAYHSRYDAWFTGLREWFFAVAFRFILGFMLINFAIRY